MLDSFGKMVKYQISSKSVQWEPSCSMERNDEANSRFLKFCVLRIKGIKHKTPKWQYYYLQ